MNIWHLEKWVKQSKKISVKALLEKNEYLTLGEADHIQKRKQSDQNSVKALDNNEYLTLGEVDHIQKRKQPKQNSVSAHTWHLEKRTIYRNENSLNKTQSKP